MSNMFARFLIAMVLLATLSSGGSAQSSTRGAGDGETSALMTPGAHVRVKLPGEHAWTGTLVSLAGDSMLVRGTTGSDTTLVRLSQATYVSVSTGMRSSRHLVRNTAIGLGLGSLIGWQGAGPRPLSSRETPRNRLCRAAGVAPGARGLA
mgnify:CR=1 FL=1